jgi:hypothetical protein
MPSGRAESVQFIARKTWSAAAQISSSECASSRIHGSLATTCSPVLRRIDRMHSCCSCVSGSGIVRRAPNPPWRFLKNLLGGGGRYPLSTEILPVSQLALVCNWVSLIDILFGRHISFALLLDLSFTLGTCASSQFWGGIVQPAKTLKRAGLAAVSHTNKTC